MNIEELKLLVNAITPIAVIVLGILVLRRIESIKASVATQVEFRKKWADSFFECCHEFMASLERDMAVLTMLSGLQNRNDEWGLKLQDEVKNLHPKLSELELRIRRSVIFAPNSGDNVKNSANKCIQRLGQLLHNQGGNVDNVISAMNEFNHYARIAHEEMIGD